MNKQGTTPGNIFNKQHGLPSFSRFRIVARHAGGSLKIVGVPTDSVLTPVPEYKYPRSIRGEVEKY